MALKKDFRTLYAEEIELMVSEMTPKFVKLLLYKDARCDQAILDETVGPMDWQRKHLRDNANCIVSIWDSDKKMWIEKEDTGSESAIEREKGLASDSFKRACTNWGIGRELYSMPVVYFPKEDCNINASDGLCSDTFSVIEVNYEDRKITRLVVKNNYTGKSYTSYAGGKPWEVEAYTENNTTPSAAASVSKENEKKEKAPVPKPVVSTDPNEVLVQEAHIATLKREIARTGIDEKALLSRYKKERFEDLTMANFNMAMKAFEKTPSKK